MTVAYQMPVCLDLAKKLGRRRWRKPILRTGHIAKEVNGRVIELDVDHALMDTYVQNFMAGAKDQVQYLAKHDEEDHEAFRGDLVGLERQGDLLWGYFEVTDRANRVLEENPKLGASVSVVDRFERADGRKYGPTLCHVAATFDPEVSRLGDWVRADLSASSTDAELIDFTTAPPDSNTPATSGGKPPKEGAPVPTALTDEELAQVRALLPALSKLAAPDTEPDKPEARGTDASADAEPEFTDAELDDIASGTDASEADGASESTDAPQLVAASAERDEALELANARIDTQQIELARLRAKDETREYEAERDDLARNFGIPPRITDLCRPWLSGSHRIELSAGKQSDPGADIRKLLHELGRTYKALDLSAPTGTAHETSAEQAQRTEDDVFLAAQHARNGR